MPAGLLSIKIGSRFLVVTLFPNVALVALIGALVVSGAPAHRPSWDRAVASVTDPSVGGVALAALLVLIASAALHPLNIVLIQFMEGYWQALPFGAWLEKAAAERGERYREQLHALENDGHDVSALLEVLPTWPYPVRPTTLGNVLTSGEIRAGKRYGYETADVLPRLMHLVSESVRLQLDDTRNQLDLAARLCGLSLIAVPVTTLLLISHGLWLAIPVLCYLFAWVSYRAAVAAARRFGTELGIAFDLHHLNLWDAMSLERPANLDVEHEDRAPILTRLLSGQGDLGPAQRRRFIWQK